MQCSRCDGERAISSTGREYVYCRLCLRKIMSEWRITHREELAAATRRAYQRDRETYCRKARERRKTIKGYEVAKRGQHRHRARKRGVLIVREISSACGVCGRSLLCELRWPHPMATTVGHEPPLSRATPGSVVVERPEHWSCNSRKGTRTDAELRSLVRDCGVLSL